MPGKFFYDSRPIRCAPHDSAAHGNAARTLGTRQAKRPQPFLVMEDDR
jgi:hypothetical protein